MTSVRTGLRGWVALTGTPGVGKSSVVDRLRLACIPHVSVGGFAQDHGLDEGVDPQRTSVLVDPARVGRTLASFQQKDVLLVLDGHWAHDIPGVVGAIVLRCRPRELRRRLAARRWPPRKIEENVEAEAIDLVLQEAVARLGPRRVWEVDTSGRDAEAVARDVFRILRGNAQERRPYAPGRVDWSQDLLAEAPRNP